jgi:hypothetical protein
MFYYISGSSGLLLPFSQKLNERSWLSHNVTSRKVGGSIRSEVIGFFNWANPSSRSISQGSTQSLTGMSTRSLPEGKVRPAHKADNLTAIC